MTDRAVILEKDRDIQRALKILGPHFDLMRRREISAVMGEKLVLDLAPKEGVLFHGAGLKLGRSILVFLAESGGGKSTLLSFSKKGRTVHDDKMAVLRAGGCWYASGVPMLDNKGKWGRVDCAPLSALFLIEKSKLRYIKRLPPREAFPRVACFAIEPSGSGRIRKLVSQALMELIVEVPVYRFGYVLGDDVSKFLLESLAVEK